MSGSRILLFRSILLICAVGALTTANAQFSLRKGLSIETNLHYGRVIKHTSKLFFELESNSPGIEFNFLFQTYGRRPWQSFHNYPLLGLGAYYFSLGNSRQLGHAIAFVPNLTLKPIKRPSFDLIFQLGSGIAFLTKVFDRVENPLNNAISTHWNNASAFKLGINWFTSPKWTLSAGGSFIHFSNGSNKLPNFGLNVPAAYVGLRYTPKALQTEDFLAFEPSTESSRPWGIHSHLGLAYVEILSIGGPRYPVYLASLGGFYHFNPYSRLHVGLEYEFNRAAYVFGNHTYTFTDEKDARRRSARYMIYGGYEFLFGPLGIQLQLGWYASRSSLLRRADTYAKLITRYYFPPIRKLQTRFYANVQLKTHVFNAEFVAFGVGAAF